MFGISVLYLLCLSFGACLNMAQIKSVMYWIDPNVRYAKREIDVIEVCVESNVVITIGKGRALGGVGDMDTTRILAQPG